MPKLEVCPRKGGDRGNGEDSEAAEEKHVPPLKAFSSTRNLLHWRTDAVRPILRGAETCSTSSHQLALNGSQHFQWVYGSGSQASAFRSSVEGTFEFVTNGTPYCYSEAPGFAGVAENGKREVTDTSKANQREGQPVWATDNGDSNTLLLPSGTSYLPPTGQTLEQSHDSTPAGHAAGTMCIPAGDSLAREATPTLSHSLLPDPADPLPSMPPLHRSASHSEEPSLDLAAQGGEMEEEFAEGGQDGQAEDDVLVLPPPAVPLFVPVIVPLPGRRHLSV